MAGQLNNILNTLRRYGVLIDESTFSSEQLPQDFSSVIADTRIAKEKMIFVAIKGEHFDSHKEIPSLVKQFPSSLFIVDKQVWEKSKNLDGPFKNVLAVNSSRKAYGILHALLHGFPYKKMLTVAITGTNGKTSTGFMLSALLSNFGIKNFFTGTLGDRLDSGANPSCDKAANLTTPDAAHLFANLSQANDQGAQVFITEASSHALDQARLFPIKFDVCLFTSFSQDHLDYHKTMDNYWRCKKLLFTEYAKSDASVILEESLGPIKIAEIQKLFPELTIYGSSDTENIDFPAIGWDESHFPYPSQFLRRNFTAALFALRAISEKLRSIDPINKSDCLAIQSWFDQDKIDLTFMPQVPGRMQRLTPWDIYVDYAHTPDALEKALQSLKETFKTIIVVFGCGGNRDAAKRPLMAQAAEKWANLSVVTSDNPRNEPADAILNDIEQGFSQAYRSQCKFLVDRQSAIHYAIDRYSEIIQGSLVSKNLAAPCAVLIAGKGHESYQEFEKGRRISFDDCKVARSYLSKLPVNIISK